MPTITSHRGVLRSFLIVAGLVAGCPTPDQEQQPTPNAEVPDTKAEDPVVAQAGLAQAHRESLDLGRPLAVDALRLSQPMAVWERGEGALRVPPQSKLGLSKARIASKKAFKELEQIKGHFLEPEHYVEWQSAMFTLRRLERRSWTQPPTLRAPDIVFVRIDGFVDAWMWEAAGAGVKDGGAGLEQAAGAVADALRDLGAGSEATVAATLEDLQRLQSRLEALGRRFPAAQSGVDTAVKTLADAQARVQAQRDALASGEAAQWTDDDISPAGGGPVLRRLPAVQGVKWVQLWFKHQEASAESPQAMADRLLRTVRRLRQMQERVPAPTDLEPRAVDQKRCEVARAKVTAWAEGNGGLPQGGPDCSVIVRALQGEALDDADLLLVVLERVWLRPRMLDNLRQTGEMVALMRGDIAPESHRLAGLIAAAAGIGDPAASARVLLEARFAACEGAAAVLHHAGVGTEEAATARLKSSCPEQSPAAWIAKVEARPHAALRGVGLGLIEDGPAAAAALERYWWVPLGLVMPLAQPPPPPPPPDPMKFLRGAEDL